jgi:hypothetical protein
VVCERQKPAVKRHIPYLYMSLALSLVLFTSAFTCAFTGILQNASFWSVDSIPHADVLNSSMLPSLYLLSSRTRLWGPFNSSQHAGVLCKIIHLSFVAHQPINSSTVPPPLPYLFDNLVNPSSTPTIHPPLIQLAYLHERASTPCPVDVVSARLLLPPLMTRTSTWQMSPSRQMPHIR